MGKISPDETDEGNGTTSHAPKSLPPLKESHHRGTESKGKGSEGAGTGSEKADKKKELEIERINRLAAIKEAQAHAPEDTFGVTIEELAKVCNFDKRTSPHQLEMLRSLYGGVDGIACLLRTDLETGLKVAKPDAADQNKKKRKKVSPDSSESANNASMEAADKDLRIETFGQNLIPPPRSETILEIVWGTIKEDPILKILLIGACIVLVLGTVTCPHDGWLEGLVVFIAVFIVLSVTAGNDWSKDRKFKKLLLLQSDKRTKVIRGGVKDEISSWDIVVGDVVDLGTGDEIPADGLFISGNRLVVDESPLTGESIPVKKSLKSPYMFSGCQVSEGTGQFLVTGVGVNSSGGQIQELLNEAQNEETVLQLKLKHVAVLIGQVGIASGIATFLGLAIRWAVDWARGNESYSDACGGTVAATPVQRIQLLAQHFVIGLTVVVVAVPEGLPLAVTISLAFSMFKMIQEKCFVRHLDASETMGEATCICTDKTGTLTENKMTVVRINVADRIFCGEGSGEKEKDITPYTPNLFEDKIKSILAESICTNSDCFIKQNPSNGQDMFVGSATEGALLLLVRKLGINYEDVRKATAKVEGGIWTFSSERKRMSSLVVPNAKSPDSGKYRLYTKGASEIILSLCTNIYENSSTVSPMSTAARNKLQNLITTWASDGLRTIGVAYRNMDEMITTLDNSSSKEPEYNLVWLCLIGIKDPVRKEVPLAVAQCQRAGLTIRMVTGDNYLTASKIARECGILFGSGIAIEGPDFRALSEEKKMEIIPRLQVLARSSPSDKHTLVSMLKNMGEVVAVTGDGTNDAPALKEADVGFAMGVAGTQIARNASDIILLDDNFVSLVSSIKWGRNVLNSVRKFLQFQLGVNLVAIILTFIGSMTVGESPLNTVQLLWVNLIMDTLGALALASDDPESDILDHPPHARTASLLSFNMRMYILMQMTYQVIATLVILLAGDTLVPIDMSFHSEADNKGHPTKRVKTMVFSVFVLCQIANEFAARQLNGELNIFRNVHKNYIFMVIILIIVSVQVVGIEFGGSFLGTCSLSGVEWAVSFGIAVGNLVFVFINRILLRIFSKANSASGRAPSTREEVFNAQVQRLSGARELVDYSAEPAAEKVEKQQYESVAIAAGPARTSASNIVSPAEVAGTTNSVDIEPKSPAAAAAVAFSSTINEQSQPRPSSVFVQKTSPEPGNNGEAILQIEDDPAARIIRPRDYDLPLKGGALRQRSKWRTLQASVTLIGSYRGVTEPGYEFNGIDPEFKKTWMRFRKESVHLPTKHQSLSRSAGSLKSL